MKLRKHICPVALVVVALAFLSVGSHAFGQGLQPPFMAPTPPSLTYGAFYFQAGVKYRNVDSFRFDVSGASQTIVVNPGTVPFGPTTAGAFGVGTGKLGFDGVTAPTSWFYDNGGLFSTPTPPGAVITCAGPPVGTCSGPDLTWSYSTTGPIITGLTTATAPELARYVVGTTSAAPCCVALGDSIIEIGSFSIVDPTTQVNNLGSLAGTTQVTYSLALADSLAFTTNTTPDINRVLQAAAVGPSFEFGYQWSNFFDVFYGFSWFTTSNSMSLSSVIQGQGSRTTITDTFPFLSDDTSAWPIFNFNSSDSAVGTTLVHNYRISPNGPGQGVLPTRQFSSVADATIPTEDIQANIFTSAEFTPLENRFGARSWAPLYGLGRLGATLGTAVIPTYFKITGSRTDVALGPVDGAVAPGTVLVNEAREYNNWTTLYGLFVGGDLSMGNTGYFLYASADYMWATNFHYDLGAVTTTFNPGGFTAGLSAGMQF
ncbi:MAG: hypothetical protein ACLP5H_16915 [Desulfomonilaceae bacterium]